MTKFQDSFLISTSKPPLMPTTSSSPSILTSNSSAFQQTVSFSISPPDLFPPLAPKLNVSFTQDVEFNEKMSKADSEFRDQVKSLIDCIDKVKLQSESKLASSEMRWDCSQKRVIHFRENVLGKNESFFKISNGCLNDYKSISE